MTVRLSRVVASFLSFNMALTGIFEVAMAARDVLGKERYTEDDCRKVATELASFGLKTYAALRLGFPPDPMRRSEMVRGLCKEVKLEDAFELVEAMALGALSIRFSSSLRTQAVAWRYLGRDLAQRR